MPHKVSDQGNPVGGWGASGVFLVVGADKFLLDRAVSSLIKEVKRQFSGNDFSDIESVTLPGKDVSEADIYEALSPSLFASEKLVIIEQGEQLSAAMIAILGSVAQSLPDGFFVIIAHSGGGAKKNMTALTKISTHRTDVEVVKNNSDRIRFVLAEFKHHGHKVSHDLAQTAIEFIGNDTANLAAAVSQLCADCGHELSEQGIKAYFRGRPESSGFEIADRCVAGNAAGAAEALRWALFHGLSPVVIADVLAEAIQVIARMKFSHRDSGADLAQETGIPLWKLKKYRPYLRSWTINDIIVALREVAELNANVKGGHMLPEFALESSVLRIAHHGAAKLAGKL